MGQGHRALHPARRPELDGHRGVPAPGAALSVWVPERAWAAAFVEACAAFGAPAGARPEAGGWLCARAGDAGGAWALVGDGAAPPGPREARVPFGRLTGPRPQVAAGAACRLAGLPEEAAGAGSDGWRWARAALPAPAAEALRGPSLAAHSGARAFLGADAAGFVAGVEGESLLAADCAHAALAPDAAMAPWLAVGAACAGARALVELPPGAATDAAGRWCAAARLPVLFLNVKEGAAPLSPADWRAARAAAEARREPLRLEVAPAALAELAAAAPPEPAAPPAPLSGSPSLAVPRGAGPLPSPRPMAALAPRVGEHDLLGEGASPLARALAAGAADASLRPDDLFVFSAGPAPEGLEAYRASNLGDGAAPAAAGARRFDARRKCVAVVGAPKGMTLGWLLHLSSVNADLTVVAAPADAAACETARAAFEAAGGGFYARLRPEDGKAAGEALSAALRHRGLAWLQLDPSAPTAVLRDLPRPRTWEETAS